VGADDASSASDRTMKNWPIVVYTSDQNIPARPPLARDLPLVV